MKAWCTVGVPPPTAAAINKTTVLCALSGNNWERPSLVVYQDIPEKRIFQLSQSTIVLPHLQQVKKKRARALFASAALQAHAHFSHPFHFHFCTTWGCHVSVSV